MDNIRIVYESAKNWVDFSKFEDRYRALFDEMTYYIKESNYSEQVRIDELILGYALVDYFKDAKNIKNSNELEHLNSIRIVSHTAYWLLKRRPLQIIKSNKDVMMANEHFVLSYILDFLEGESDERIVPSKKAGLSSFAQMLFYFLRYRVDSPEVLELSIASFFAGQIFQEKDQDISDKVAKIS